MATGNIVRDARIGIRFSMTKGADVVMIANNRISGAKELSIAGYDHWDAVTGDLSLPGPRFLKAWSSKTISSLTDGFRSAPWQRSRGDRWARHHDRSASSRRRSLHHREIAGPRGEVDAVVILEGSEESR